MNEAQTKRARTIVADCDTPAEIDAVVQDALGRKLRETYEAVVREDVPERLLALLEELKRKESGKGGA